MSRDDLPTPTGLTITAVFENDVASAAAAILAVLTPIRPSAAPDAPEPLSIPEGDAA